MLTGHRFTALEGAAYGLVDFAVNDMAAAEAQLAELVAGVRRCAPGQIRRPKNCWKPISISMMSQ